MLSLTDKKSANRKQGGFTLIEVIIAGMIMIILCVGVVTVYEQTIRLNRGNSIRTQALSILQKEVEFYRALRYEPVAPDPLLNGHLETVTKTNVASGDGTRFDISVTIDNDPYTPDVVETSADIPEANCKFKQITIKAIPHTAQQGWLSDLKTTITFRRVRLVN